MTLTQLTAYIVIWARKIGLFIGQVRQIPFHPKVVASSCQFGWLAMNSSLCWMNFYTSTAPQKTRITENRQENHSVYLASPKNRFNERFVLLLKNAQTNFFLCHSLLVLDSLQSLLLNTLLILDSTWQYVRQTVDQLIEAVQRVSLRLRHRVEKNSISFFRGVRMF